MPAVDRFALAVVLVDCSVVLEPRRIVLVVDVVVCVHMLGRREAARVVEVLVVVVGIYFGFDVYDVDLATRAREAVTSSAMARLCSSLEVHGFVCRWAVWTRGAYRMFRTCPASSLRRARNASRFGRR